MNLSVTYTDVAALRQCNLYGITEIKVTPVNTLFFREDNLLLFVKRPRNFNTEYVKIEPLPDTLIVAASAMGSSKTPAKAAAARQNGRKGGRPRKTQAPE